MNAFRRTVIAQCLVVAFGGTVGLAFAEPTDSEADSKSSTKIVITGSHIKRVDAETATPIQVISREDIEKSGATTVTDLLKRAPASNAGGFDETQVAGFSPGAGGISLRGLGPQATLVLINGRRVAPHGFTSGGQSTFTDVNSISVSAIERVEILLDSASAIYGSEAMGGVINIILRKDFRGAELGVGYGESSRHDAKRQDFNFTGGIGDLGADNFNLIINAEHTERDGIWATNRPYSATADYSRFGSSSLNFLSSYSYPGNLYSTAPAFLGPMAGCQTVNQTPGSPLAGRCVYDHATATMLTPNKSRDSLFLNGVWNLTRDIQAFGDMMYTRNKGDTQRASYNTATYWSTGTLSSPYLALDPNHPQNPYGTDVLLRYRFADVPNKISWTDEAQRYTVGARIADLAGWDIESAIVRSQVDSRIDHTGIINDAVLANEVVDPNTGYVNNNFHFGNPSLNDPALMGRLYPTLRDHGKTSTTSVDVSGSRELMALRGGPLSIATGAEVRRETFETHPDPLVEAGTISVQGGSSANGARTVKAVYAELSAAILPGWEAQLAGRSEQYPVFGNAFTPKIATKVKPFSFLALRSTYSEGFRAPSLTETSQKPTRGFYSNVVDPVLCPDPTVTTNPNCALDLPAVSGSNPNLRPEKSKSRTIGFVLEPLDDVSISFDYYHITRRNEIAGIDPQYLLANEASYPGYVVRDPGTNQITELRLPYQNLGATDIRGFDIDLKGKMSLGEWGKLAGEFIYNKTPHYRVRATATADETEWAGTYTQPTERWQAKATWDFAGWSTTLAVNHVGGYKRAYTPLEPPCPYANTSPSLCSVAAWTTTDLYVSYSGFKDWRLSVAVDNLEDKDPPFDERMAGWYTGFNGTYHNPYGRYVRLGAKYTFK